MHNLSSIVITGHARGGGTANASAAVAVGGGGSDSGRKGPQRMEPLASFGKHVGASSALKPWEGAPVLIDGSVPYRLDPIILQYCVIARPGIALVSCRWGCWGSGLFGFLSCMTGRNLSTVVESFVT